VAQEADCRQRREELKVEMGTAFLNVLRSRSEEDAALAGRVALHSRSARAEDRHLQMQSAKAAAVEALRAEKYDAMQVEACHAKKKQRLDARADALAARTQQSLRRLEL